jgi:single-stranded-DNA-specific exonuclease
MLAPQPKPSSSTSSIILDHSICGKQWVIEAYDERLALTLAQRQDLPDIVAQIMAARGILPDEAHDFLNPTLRALMPDPEHLKDMGKAAARFVEALQKKEKICVFGDYDVDGATSSALIIRFARACGHKVDYYIPDRMKEGYGPNEAAMLKLASEGYKLIITVDCGITAHAPLQAAKEAGVDVVVLDHHQGEPQMPEAHAVVNPNRFDETSEQRHLAAVGVTFLFLAATQKQLKAQNFFEGRAVPNLLEELDIVALGTVCDMVALKGANRAFVRQGLKVLASSNNMGIRALIVSSRANKAPVDSGTAGFMLGPRVNAGGRVGKSDLGVRLLSSESEEEVQQIAATLEKLNEERRRIEQETVDEALKLVPLAPAVCVMVEGQGWHPGVIGLVSSRLKERFNRPSFATAFDEKGMGKGSCRSVRGIDIGGLIIAARQEGLLINGGGHAMAAGYTVGHNHYPEFKAFIEARIAKKLEEAPLEPTLVLDGILAVPGATVGLAEKLLALSPFGMGNPEPRFAVMDAVLIKADIMAEKHLRLNLSDGRGSFLRAVCWRAMDNHLGPALMIMQKGQRLHLAGHLSLNHWNGRTEAQLVVEDGAIA